LRLLGIMAGVADGDRRVRRALPEIAQEFALSPAQTDSWAAQLEAVGVIRREGTSTVIGGAEPAYVGAMRLQDFLDVAAELDAQPPRRSHHALRPVGAVLAAAAVLVAVLAVPGVIRQRPAPVSSNRDDTVISSSDGVVHGQTSSPTGTIPTTGPTVTAGPRTGGTSSTTGVLPTTTSLLPTCPSGVPLLRVLGTTADATGRLVVSGVVENASSAAMTIAGFTLHASVGGQDISVPGSDQPLSVPAHGSAPWQVTLPLTVPAGTLVQATLGDWSWNAASVPPTCPSP
jgi:hypothetical protein